MLEVPEFKPQSAFAVTPKFRINNRSDVRAFKNDAIRAAEFLQWVIDDFIDCLFDPSVPKEVQYKTIYLYFLDIWNATIAKLRTVKPKLENVNIDAEFFSKNYAPKEKLISL